jgi:opacity protein-like surface antigen
VKRKYSIGLALAAGLILSNYSYAVGPKEDVTAGLIEKAKQAVVASVPTTRKHSFGIGLGQTFLLGDFSKDGENKITYDFFYGYSASYSFDFLLNFHFSSHDKKTESVDLLGLSMSIKSKVYDFDSFSPYLMGGLGFYRPTAERIIDGVLIESEGKYSFGFNIGAGADLRLNDKFTIGIMTQFHKPFEVAQDDQKDISGAYLKLLLLGMFHF